MILTGGVTSTRGVDIKRAVVYVADLERALGMDAPRPHRTGSNE